MERRAFDPDKVPAPAAGGAVHLVPGLLRRALAVSDGYGSQKKGWSFNEDMWET